MPERRVQEVLTIAMLARAARDHRIRRALWRARHRQHSRLRLLRDAQRLVRLDLDELLRLAEEIGRRIAAILIGVAEPQRETRAEARARLSREYEARERRHVTAIVNAPDADPVPTYIPHFLGRGKP